ncbi:MAG: tRNA (adenosine(37)-N6)-dimethylallyltransferase MiaA [Treponema sp.]|nr:tRNA (adenosine(37)-N6)-dimethylallyltransferase MiaA [Treponema sp.]
MNEYNAVMLLGPTAVGKTSLAVSIADTYNWDIISADSRQVYKGLDIGSGKDLKEYCVGEKSIPYHLIDITTLDEEYNVFKYQTDFYNLFDFFCDSGKIPFIVGGTGMYLDSIVRNYYFMPVPENIELREYLATKSLEELGSMLMSLKPDLHNKSDLTIRERVVRAIEIQLYMKDVKPVERKQKVNAFILGTTLPREILRNNITLRLKERFKEGMIDEVQGLHDSGYSWERLEKLGLEYRYISQFLEGKIDSEEELFNSLNHAIHQFAKRQETWFRGMEKKGALIHWLPSVADKEARYNAAIELLETNGFKR